MGLVCVINYISQEFYFTADNSYELLRESDLMRLPTPIYNAVPNIYIAMGVLTWYFVIEAVVFDKGVGLVAFLSVSSFMMIANAFHIKHLRRRNKVTG